MRTFSRNPLLLLGLTLCLVSCGSDPPTGGGGDGETPTTPRAVTPGHNQSGQETQLTLVWRSSDPNGDPLTYDLYFGDSEPPPLVASDLVDTSYTVNGLRSNCAYFWKVVVSDPGGNTAPSDIFSFATTDEYRFPLAVGNRWGYAMESRMVGSNLGSRVGGDTLLFGTATMEVVADTLFDDSMTLQIVTVVHDPPMWRGGPARLFVRNTTEGRITYAYEQSSILTPGKAASGTSVIFQNNQYDSLEELIGLLSDRLANPARTNQLIYFEDPPVTALQYPLEQGARWIYRQGGELPFRIDKRVEGTEQIETAAGKFDVIIVRWQYDLGQDGSFDDSLWIEDRISAEGLVRREIAALGIVEVSYDSPNDTVSVYDFYQTFELADFNVE